MRHLDLLKELNLPHVLISLIEEYIDKISLEIISNLISGTKLEIGFPQFLNFNWHKQHLGKHEFATSYKNHYQGKKEHEDLLSNLIKKSNVPKNTNINFLFYCGSDNTLGHYQVSFYFGAIENYACLVERKEDKVCWSLDIKWATKSEAQKIFDDCREIVPHLRQLIFKE